jgi:multidrug efflux pump subunit AcrA (membrane-fusion protein)
MAERARRRTRRRRRTVVAGTAGVLVVAGAGTAWAMTGSGGPDYRLATVGRADVTQTVEADGTLAAHRRATVRFGAAGTVAAVDVAVGDHVRAGQRLASLDRAALQQAVTAARGTLAQARQRLADDEQAQLTGSSSSDGLASDSSGSATPSGTDAARERLLTGSTAAAPRGSAGGSSQAGLRAAQRAVVSAQHALDAAIATVTADVSAVQKACTAPGSAPQTTTVTAAADGTVSGTVGDTATVVTLLDTATTSANPQSLAAGQTYRFAGLTAGDSYQLVLVPLVDTSACSTALATLNRDQAGPANRASVAAADARLAAALRALDTALAAQSAESSNPSASPSAAAKGGTGSSSGSSRGSSNGSSNGSSDGSSDGSANGGAAVTAAQLAADAAAVDAARAQLAVARHALGAATLTSPISGTVGAVALTAGEAVSASSSTATISVVGAGTMSVAVDIALADIDKVRAGETARVTVDGRATPFPAKVTYVGATNTSSSSGSSSTYSVTVTLDAPDARLFDGMGAHVAIVTGVARHVLSVPVSAVHAVGALTTVDVVTAKGERVRRVTLGVRGAARVEVRSGLAAGERVVLADVSAAVPSSSDNSPFGRRGSFNGFTGGKGGGPVFLGPGGGR